LSMHAFFRVSDAEVGKDLVQDTFMKAWNYIKNGGKIIMMRAFLYHILNNLIVDEYRKRKHKATSLDNLLEAGFEPTTEEHIHIVDTLDGRTTGELIKKLPSKYQSVLSLHYLEHLSLDEISKKTGQSKNTIAVQIHRGLKKLKKLYENPKE
jgi:RNA polymerase sigma-70 factor, ECF subfamily